VWHCARTRVRAQLSARAAAATIIRWGFRIASGGLASIVVTSIRPMKIPGGGGDTRGVPDLPRGLSAAITSTGPTVDYPWPRIRDGKPSGRLQRSTFILGFVSSDRAIRYREWHIRVTANEIVAAFRVNGHRDSSRVPLKEPSFSPRSRSPRSSASSGLEPARTKGTPVRYDTIDSHSCRSTMCLFPPLPSPFL